MNTIDSLREKLEELLMEREDVHESGELEDRLEIEMRIADVEDRIDRLNRKAA